MGDDNGWCLALLDDGQEVSGVVDHRPSRWDIERFSVAAPVVGDDPVMGVVGDDVPKAC